jgi:hypothetical protein
MEDYYNVTIEVHQIYTQQLWAKSREIALKEVKDSLIDDYKCADIKIKLLKLNAKRAKKFRCSKGFTDGFR